MTDDPFDTSTAHEKLAVVQMFDPEKLYNGIPVEVLVTKNPRTPIRVVINDEIYKGSLHLRGQEGFLLQYIDTQNKCRSYIAYANGTTFNTDVDRNTITARIVTWKPLQKKTSVAPTSGSC